MRTRRAAISRYSAASPRPSCVDAREELLANARDRDVGDLDLLIADEREQEIEGPRVLVQLHDEGRRRIGREDERRGQKVPSM